MAFTSDVVAPNGNPITLHTGTEAPRRFSAARFTQVGLIHTEAKWYCSASRQSWSMSEAVASGLSRVWSM
jgi:hypothetical protein